MESDELQHRLNRLGQHLDDERSVRQAAEPEAIAMSAGAGREPASDSASPVGHERTLVLRLMAGAVAIAAVAALVVAVTQPDPSHTGDIEAVAPSDTDLGPSTTGRSATSAGAEATTGPVDPMPSLASTIETLPSQVDVVAGPMVYAYFGSPNPDAELVAMEYLDDRLPDVAYRLTQGEAAGQLTHFRWAVDDPEVEAEGSVIVRLGDWSPGVAAATTDSVEIVSAEHTLDRATVAVAQTGDDLLVADVTTILGEIVADAPDPDGIGDKSDPIHGTAGSTTTGRLDIDVAVGPIPIVVRAQRSDGPLFSISEFALDAIGFAASCGTEPPITIDVGDLLGDLEDGLMSESPRALLANQGAWHHPGELASIEIRWPADPSLVGRVERAHLAESKSAGFAPDGEFFGGEELDPAGLTSREMLLAIGPSAIDPCAVVQVAVYGQRAAADWWGTALSSEWAFGFPLTVADLNPTAPPEEEPPLADELVVASDTASDRPIVPLTGSCDGLPDAPPHTGPGPDLAATIPDDLLAGFLATFSHPEANLPATGYTEVTIDDSRISWVIQYEEMPLIVIDAVRADQAWKIERWSTSAC